MLALGTTRSGKTELMKWLVPHLGPHIVVHDGKGRINWPNFHLHTQGETLQHDRWPWLIYRPPHEHIGEPDEAEPFYEWIFNRGHTVCYTDEMLTITKNGRAPMWWKACQTRGGELGISMVNGTQRPSWIPQEMLSEPEYAVLFRLNLPADRKRAAELCEIDDELLGPRALPKHYWYFVELGEQAEGPYHLRLPPAAAHYAESAAAA